jgi:hypothetical protein
VSVTITDVDPESWFMETNAARDTFMLWITSPEVYNRDVLEALLTYPFTDSTGTIVSRTDTVMLRYLKPTAPRGGERKAPSLALTTNISGKIRPGTVPSFATATPLTDPDTSKITLLQRVDSLTRSVSYVFERDSTTTRRLVMKAALEPGGSYTLICNAGAFSDIYGNTSDSTAYKISVATSEDYGSIKTKVTGYEGDIVIQLTGNKENVVREARLTSPGDVTFDLLDKGRYRLKVIYDLDSNGKWTTGDFDLGRIPEPVSYYPAELEVKINWGLEQDWDIGTMYAKDVSLRNKPSSKR